MCIITQEGVCITRMLHVHYTHVVTLVPLTERGPSVSNGSTNALTDQLVNIHSPTNVLTVHYMFTDIISLGLVHLRCVRQW